MAKSNKSKLSAKVGRFITSQNKATAAMVALSVECIDHVIAHRDWTPLARLIGGLEPRASSRIRKMVGMVLAGAKLSQDPSAQYGWRFTLSDGLGLKEEMKTLRQHVAAKHTIYGEEITKFLGMEPKGPVEYDLVKRSDSYATNALKNGITYQDAVAELRRAFREGEAKLQADYKKARERLNAAADAVEKAGKAVQHQNTEAA